MIAELIEKLVEADFKDIFQPSSREEIVRKRKESGIDFDMFEGDVVTLDIVGKRHTGVWVIDQVVMPYSEGIARVWVTKLFRGDTNFLSSSVIKSAGRKMTDKEQSWFNARKKKRLNSENVDVEEAFKDVFQPYDAKEVEKRRSHTQIALRPYDLHKDNVFLPGGKNVRLKIPFGIDSKLWTLKHLGIDPDRLKTIRRAHTMKQVGQIVNLTKEDNVKDNEGNLMSGDYILFSWLEE